MESKKSNANNNRLTFSSNKRITPSAQLNFNGIQDLPIECSFLCLCSKDIEENNTEKYIKKEISRYTDLKSLARTYLAKQEYLRKRSIASRSRGRGSVTSTSSKNRYKSEKSPFLPIYEKKFSDPSRSSSVMDNTVENKNKIIPTLGSSENYSEYSSESDSSELIDFNNINDRPYILGSSDAYKKKIPVSENSSSEEEYLVKEEIVAKNELIFPNSRYRGDINNGKPHGFGTEIWTDGSIFEGTYINGLKSGMGKFFWIDGNQYEGHFINNEMQGYGVFRWKNRNVYEGMWKKSKMHGEGNFTWANGNKYIGGYSQGIKHGYGIFIWKNGTINKGQWVNGKIQPLTVR